jgi:hypothetical protein
MADWRTIANHVGRQAAIGLGRLGARATAAAYRQVAHDVDGVAEEVHRRTAGLKKKLDDFFSEQVVGGPDRK